MVRRWARERTGSITMHGKPWHFKMVTITSRMMGNAVSPFLFLSASLRGFLLTGKLSASYVLCELERKFFLPKNSISAKL